MRTSRLNQPGRVPDAEALRQAMLQASWRRDRRVRQRRTAWRWFLWGLRRYGLPVMAGALAVAWLSAYTLDWFAAPHRAPAAPRSAAPARTPTPAASAPATAAPAVPDESRPAAAVPAPAHRDTPSGLLLDARLGRSATTVLPAAPAGPPVPDPDLKPDNWLHSKEP